MKLLLSVLIMVLVIGAGPVWAFGPGPGDCTGDSVEVTSATYTFSSDTCYYITQDLSSDDGGWTITAGDSNLRINMQDYSLTFAAADDDDDEVGLTIGANCFDITIENGDFLHGGTDSTDGSECVDIGGGCHDIKFRHCSTYVRGSNGTCIDGEVTGLYDIRFDTCDFHSDQWGFTSANASDHHPVKFTDRAPTHLGNDTLTWLEPDVNGYDFLFYKCRLWGPGGLSVGATTIIAQCSLTVDARNDLYSYPSGAADYGMKNSCAIGGALRSDNFGRSSIICSTTILAGTDYAGCDEGILLQTARCSSGTFILVFDNHIDIHNGKDHYYGYTDATGWTCKAIKIRYGNNGIKIYDNYLKTTDGDTTLSSYGMQSSTVYLISNWSSGEGLSAHLDSNIWVYNNTIIADTNGTDIERQRCVQISAGDSIPSMDHDWDSVGIHWFGNTCQSNGWIYNIGDSDGDARGVRIREDTINHLAQIGSEHHHVVCVATNWGGGDSFINNRLGECYYTSGDETDVILTWVNEWNELELWRTVECTVTAGGSPVVGDTVSFLSDANDDTLTAVTNASGVAEHLVRYYDEFTGSGAPADTVFADYHPFTIFATVNDSLLTDTLNVVWDNYQITLAHPTAEPSDKPARVTSIRRGQ